jgi:type I restriction enzyme, R subunit
MVLSPSTESVVEAAALEWFEALGYTVLPGGNIAHGEPAAEREGYGDVVLGGRLRDAMVRLNPAIPSGEPDERIRTIARELVRTG